MSQRSCINLIKDSHQLFNAEIFTGRCDLFFSYVDAFGILTTNLSIMGLFRLKQNNYILQVTIEQFSRQYLHHKYEGIK